MTCVALRAVESGELPTGAPLRAADCPQYCASLAAGECVDAPDVSADPRAAELVQGYAPLLGTNSLLAIPIRRADDVAGALVLAHAGEPTTWGEDDTEFASAIAAGLGRTLEREAQQAAAQAVLESEARYRTAAELAMDVVWEMDLEGRMTYMSPSVLTVYGYSAGECIGRPVSGFLTPHSAARAAARVTEAAAIALAHPERLCVHVGQYDHVQRRQGDPR